jgi:D-alanyl-D-alanine carboxypeptidase
MSLKKVGIAVLLLGISGWFLKRPQAPFSLSAQIDQALNEARERPLNGVILIAKGQTVLYEKAQGSFGSPTLQSQFLIASLSKQMTAVLILQLVEKGFLKLDQPIAKYLPNQKEEWTSRVTVKQLLNHTSGIVAHGQPLAFEPGSQFRYTNIAYNLLGLIAERASGKRYEELVSQLLQTCQMTESGISGAGTIPQIQKNFSRLIPGFVKNKVGIVHLFSEAKEEEFDPSSGLISTAQDLLRWNQCLHKGKILSPQSYQRMITNTTPYDLMTCNMLSTLEHSSEIIGYGFGVNVTQKEGIRSITHVGYMYGYGGVLSYYPESDLSIIVLENITNAEPPFLEIAKIIQKCVHQFLQRR